MAKKPAPETAVATTHPAMDYAQHEATYRGFTAFVKWSIISMIFVMVSLYCFIQAQQPLLGTLLLAVIPLGAIVALVTRSRRS